MNCWKCRTKLDLPENKIGFRTICPKCDTDLHTCMGCKHYMPGKPNDCLVPGTDWISDREKANFCEDFSPRDKWDDENTPTLEDVSDRLFKDKGTPEKKKGFDSLFDD